MKKVLKGWIILLICVGACGKMDVVTLPEQSQLEARQVFDVSYGSNNRQELDLFLPANRGSTTRVIILVHGGSWMEGDKSSLRPLAEFLADNGYACASINYRLTNTPERNIHPAQVNDVGSAIDFISSKASEWNISSDKFGLLGASAGAHIAMLYTYRYNANNKVKTVVSMAGPADLTDTGDVNPAMAAVVQLLIGASFDVNPLAYEQASPITHVGVTSKPTLVFHGKDDVIVSVEQSVNLKAKLDDYQVRSKLILYDNTGHEVINSVNAAHFLTEIKNWFKENVN